MILGSSSKPGFIVLEYSPQCSIVLPRGMRKFELVEEWIIKYVMAGMFSVCRKDICFKPTGKRYIHGEEKAAARQEPDLSYILAKTEGSESKHPIAIELRVTSGTINKGTTADLR